MKLNKRYVRSIRANLPFYIAASVLTMVTLLMFYLFYIAGTGINAYGDKFFSEYSSKVRHLRLTRRYRMMNCPK